MSSSLSALAEHPRPETSSRTRRLTGRLVRRTTSSALIVLLLALVAFVQPPSASAASVSWQLQSVRATDIGVGANGDVWIIGTNPVPGGYSVHHLVNGSWVLVPGGGVRIAVAPNGQPWIVNDRGEIFVRSGTSWVLTSGSARDIAVDNYGFVYVVGTLPRAGGYGIYRYIPDWNGWIEVGGGALRIAAGTNLWVVNDNLRVFRLDNGGWVALPGTATDVGANRAAAWITGTAGVPGGYTVHRFDGADWDRFSGGAVAVAVAPNGVPWIVNTYGEIFRGSVSTDPQQCSIADVTVAERFTSVDAGTLLPGESVQVTPDATSRIKPGFLVGDGGNGPEGWTDSAPSSFPLPGARKFGLLVDAGSGWRYLGASSMRVQNTTGASRQLRFRVNDDVAGNGEGEFRVQVTFACRT